MNDEEWNVNTLPELQDAMINYLSGNYNRNPWRATIANINLSTM